MDLWRKKVCRGSISESIRCKKLGWAGLGGGGGGGLGGCSCTSSWYIFSPLNIVFST